MPLLSVTNRSHCGIEDTPAAPEVIAAREDKVGYYSINISLHPLSFLPPLPTPYLALLNCFYCSSPPPITHFSTNIYSQPPSHITPYPSPPSLTPYSQVWLGVADVPHPLLPLPPPINHSPPIPPPHPPPTPLAPSNHPLSAPYHPLFIPPPRTPLLGVADVPRRARADGRARPSPCLGCGAGPDRARPRPSTLHPSGEAAIVVSLLIYS